MYFCFMRYSAIVLLLLVQSWVYGQQHTLNTYPRIYFDRGLELYEEGRFNAAIAQFEQALAIEGAKENGDLVFYHAMAKLYAQHENAEPFLNSYLNNNPNSSRANQANLALGDYFYNGGKYPAALGYYREVDEKALSPKDKDMFNFRVGFCYVFREKFKEAKEHLEKVNKGNPQYAGISQYYYGYACLMEKDYEAAFNAFRSIKDKRFEKVHFYMAQVLYQMSKYEEAIGELDKINTPRVSKNDIDWLKGKCYYRMKSYRKATESFMAVKPKMEKLSPQEQFEIGYAFAKSDQNNECLPWLRAVAKNNDSLAQIACYELGNVLLEMKNYREASFAYSEVWRTGFNEEIARISLYTQAKIAVQLGESNATKLLDKYVRMFPKSPEAKEASKLKARLLLNTDNYREAVDILEGIDDLDEATEEIYQKVTLARGMELYKSRKFDDAIELFAKCKKKQANKKYAAEASYWTAEALMQKGDNDKALTEYKSFIDMSQSDRVKEFPYAYYGQGYVHFGKKNYGEAATYFDEFTKKLTNNRYEERVVHDAYLRLGDCYLMTRDLERSVRAYAYVSGKNGTDADYALYQSSVIYGLLHRSEEKVSTLKRLIDQYPRSRYAMDGYNDIASEYMTMNRTKEAESYYKQILTLYPGTQLTRKAYSTLGRIYYNDKKVDEAVSVYTRLYDEFKGTQDAQSASDMVKFIYTEEGRAKDYVKWASSRGGISSSAEDSVLYETAMNAYDRQDYKKAAPSFETYLSEKPNGNFVISSLYYLGMSYEELKQPQKAIEAYKKVAVANSGDLKEDATLAVLKIYGNSANCDEIIQYVEILESITRSKDIQRKAWKTMMYCYNKSGNKQGLKTVAGKVLEDQSVDSDLKLNSQIILARGLVEEKKYEEALPKLKDIYSSGDSRFAAEAKYLQAQVLFEQDSMIACQDVCFELLDQFNAYDEWVCSGLILLGDAFAKTNDLVSAKDAWNKVIENFTDKKYVDIAKQRLATTK